jgi:hypothetical protein
VNPHNPASIEAEITDIADRIENGVIVVTNAERDSMNARREFDLAYARAYGAASGSIKDREYAADLATAELRQAYEIAEVAFHHAQRLSRALERKLDAKRSVGVSVRQAYGAA